MTKERLALEVVDHLKREYPDVGRTLDYGHAWELLVSVRLVTQCTDVGVNTMVEDLYTRYSDVDALIEADVEDVERVVRPYGLGHSRARDISACMKILKEQCGGKMSDDSDALLEFPGVGRKSTNLITGDVFGRPAIVTGTHCVRLVNCMGLVDGIKESKKVEMALRKLVSPKEGSDSCHRSVFHGRDVCTTRTKPRCEACCPNDICEEAGVE